MSTMITLSCGGGLLWTWHFILLKFHQKKRRQLGEVFQQAHSNRVNGPINEIYERLQPAADS